MPGDVPVVSVAVGMGGPRNAGLFAVQILATGNESLREGLRQFKQRVADKVVAKNQQFQRDFKPGAASGPPTG
jgi:phosphoribosylcarboxyaminoimidazole (NCAIR) mutase